MNKYIKEIYLRIVILDIFRKKTQNLLVGDTPEEEYEFYMTHFFDNEAYKQSLLKEYPELDRLQFIKDSSLSLINLEIEQRFQMDRREIRQIWNLQKEKCGIKKIDPGQGDAHNGGSSVAKVELEDGTILYYKPHSLVKNVKYQNLYAYLCQRTGVSCREVKYLAGRSYGWEENIQNKPCETKEEVKRYYFRMGLHLFLGYALGATDLHGENIIAHGEHPIIIDMETYPGYIGQVDRLTVSEQAIREDIEAGKYAEIANRTHIMTSVLHTGMLPVLTWGSGSQKVPMSAMNMCGKIKTPFRMPVVKEDKTSNIHIEYENLEFEFKECIVRLDGEAVCSAEYTDDLIQGFRAAYKETLKDPQIIRMMECFFEERSRVILRHTQQYAMYRFASYHPDYMKKRSHREKLLSVIHKEGETSLQREIRDYEINSLLEMDIPYFEIDGRSKSLFDGNGKEYREYLPETPYNVWLKHMKRLNCEDMERQCEYVHLSMGLLNRGYTDKAVVDTSKTVRMINKAVVDTGTTAGLDRNRMLEQAERIADWVCQRAFVKDSDISWTGLHFWDSGYWSPKACEMYLYDGIAGIAVFLAKYLQVFSNEKEKKGKKDNETWNDRRQKYELAVQKLKRYTDGLHGQQKLSQSLHTGLYEGESSLVYAYLLLHEITGEEDWIAWAKRHFEVVLRLIPTDTALDLLNGNAGAAVAALKLYQATGEKFYLETAVKVETDLWEKVLRTEHGCGWKLAKTEVPLGGTAHGNSGFLMMYAQLYENTPNAAYLEKIRELLTYEDSLYAEELGNWLDMRDTSVKHTVNGWCHGAPGILLVRMHLLEIMPQEQILADDIEKAVKALFYAPKDGKICLCHGLAGNLLIMKRYLECYPNETLRVEYRNDWMRLLEALESKRNLVVTERFHPGFMNGIVGVGMALLNDNNL